MVNTLSSIREDIRDVLTEAGIKAVEYVQENIVPPVAVIVPATPYVTTPEGTNPFGHYTVSVSILLIAGKGTNRTAAAKIDSMIVECINALDDDWDIAEVTAPQEMNLKGIKFMGAVVTLETDTKLEKEND